MAAATQMARKTNGQATTSTSSKAKAPPAGTKVKIRRLPADITEDQVWAIIGDEWKSGNDKVNWTSFARGKIPNDPYKAPQLAVQYLRVTRDEDIQLLREVVLKATWPDNKYTPNGIPLPPDVEIAQTKIPPNKRRTDPRQGTIDQDPDFIAYLTSLTQPEPQVRDSEGADQAASTTDEANKENVKITSTPLVEFIKEKKANKAKEAAAAKSAKHARQDSQGGKAKATDDTKKKGKDTKAEKSEKEKEKAKEPVKLLTKKAAAQEAAEAAKAVAGQTATGKSAGEATPKSRRANIAQAAKILQRDLGLSPGSAHRRARQNAAKVETAAPPETASSAEKEVSESKESETAKVVPTGPKAQTAEGTRKSRNKAKAVVDANKGKATENPAKPTTGPIILLKKDSKKDESTGTGVTSPSTPATASSAAASAAQPAPPTGPKASGKSSAASAKPSTPAQQKKTAIQLTPGATRAFVKHANPSQGVTEPLLQQAMETFGPVTFVEIDKRKGFAYVDFGDAESLRKAVVASPVVVGQGTVQVLERKDKKPATAPATTPSTSTASATTAQPVANEKGSGESDKPKRGNRGRGKRGGASGSNVTEST